MSKYKKMRVIGITGSYGKSSTKEFLATLLSEKYRVYKTPKNINTEMGIAQLILSTDFTDYDYFIVEMGAYKEKEIDIICKMVRPEIGILTGINDQHIALFGGQQAIVRGKFELLQALPNDTSIAILNWDNRFIRKYSGKINGKKIRISCYNTHADYFADEISVMPDIMEFNFYSKNYPMLRLRAHLAGIAALHNIILAIAAAIELGLNSGEIISGIEKIRPQEGTMSIHRLKNNAVCVDDSYNANSDGVLAAINYLKLHPFSRKILFLSRVLELGVRADKRHSDFLKQAGNVATKIVLTQSDYDIAYRHLIELMPLFDVDKLIITRDPAHAFHDIKSKITERTIILCEGRSSTLLARDLKRW